jgi:hypothetical protein
VEVRVEAVEGLSLPPGSSDAPPALGEPPLTTVAARVRSTYLARELARELKVRFGVHLQSDVDGLELAQRCLRETFPEGLVRSDDDEREILRYGAYVSELFARRLGARWVDLEGEPDRWAMLVPSRSRPDQVTRIWPVARVKRFVSMGHKERDLVSYLLEIESLAR